MPLTNYVASFGRRSRPMASGLAGLSQASEASQIDPPLARRARQRKTNPAFNNPSYNHGNPISQMVGTSGKRLFIYFEVYNYYIYKYI